MSDEESYKKYDHASSLSRQIERLNEQIVKGLKAGDSKDYGDYLDSIIMGLMTIENFYLHPFISDDYETFTDKTILSKGNAQKIMYITEAQKKLSKLMDDEELFFTSYKKEKLGAVDKKDNEGDEN